MLKVRIPNNHIAEREYITGVLLEEFLGLSITVSVEERVDYVLEWEDKSVVIEDHFFRHLEVDYLQRENIPARVEYGKNPFTPEIDIPVIYGTAELEVREKQIVTGIDVFASAFFMLTRWEEAVKSERAAYDRFSAAASLAYQNGFLDRPVVNEYTEMLWNMLSHLKIPQERKKTEYQFICTHDVDYIHYWQGPSHIIKAMAGDVKNKQFQQAFKRLPEYVGVKRKKVKDPYDTFEWLMDLSERQGIQSHFYFMSGGVTEYDNHYQITDPRAAEVIKKIKARGHVVGFHPSFASYNDPVQWRREKEALDQVAGIQVTDGRHHYLRFSVPDTWEIWEQNEMKIDSSLGYFDQEGFRCGTCSEFPVFNVKTRKRLHLRERPLIVMEATLAVYKKLKPKEMLERIRKLVDTTKNYNGNFVFLWHNSSFNHRQWKNYHEVYEKVLEEA